VRWRISLASKAGEELHPIVLNDQQRCKEAAMTITVQHITPLIALIAGILILIIPRLLNFVVAIYLIIVGLVGLNNIHHFIR
jgi:Protein of unknown function (DUF3096)